MLQIEYGSVLGPISYLLAVNYLPQILKFSTVSMFADDTLITVASKTLEEAVSKLNSDLDLLHDWINYNNLALNVDKTKYLVITDKTVDTGHIRIKIGGQDIEKVSEIKYLGIIIDDRLKFLSHLKYIKNKLSSKLALFRRLSNKLDLLTRILLYKSLVSPHFDYCASILFCLPENRIKELQKLQNKFMRCILRVNKRTKIKEMLKVLGFQSVEQRLAYNSLKLMYKVDHGLAAEEE